MKLFRYIYTVESLRTATFTAKVRWPLLGGGRYSEVAALRGSTVYFLFLNNAFHNLRFVAQISDF